MTALSPDIVAAAKAHARAEFPKESCGLVARGQYIACRNIHPDPENHFEIPPSAWVKAGKVEAVIHSHPNGPLFPSQADMEGQLQTNVPWVIIALDDERVGEPVMWGGDTPIPPIVGRQFMHGVTDCYSLLRDMFRLGKDKLLEQGIEEWPYSPVTLPDYARKDGWWTGDDDFYEVEPPKLGFREIEQHEARPGDVFLMKIRSTKFNHAGMLIGGGLLVHHLPMRLSRREPAGLWGRQAERWIRYEGPVDA